MSVSSFLNFVQFGVLTLSFYYTILFIGHLIGEATDWNNYLLVEMNIRKTLQASPVFSFIVLNLAEKAVLHFCIILDYVKSAKSNK